MFIEKIMWEYFGSLWYHWAFTKVHGLCFVGELCKQILSPFSNDNMESVGRTVGAFYIHLYGMKEIF